MEQRIIEGVHQEIKRIIKDGENCRILSEPEQDIKYDCNWDDILKGNKKVMLGNFLEIVSLYVKHNYGCKRWEIKGKFTINIEGDFIKGFTTSITPKGTDIKIILEEYEEICNLEEVITALFQEYIHFRQSEYEVKIVKSYFSYTMDII